MKRHSLQRAFTLIELLVVVAIIGLLSSIVMASLTTARQKGRDARRISDIKSIQLALELYYDANGEYPADIYDGSLVSGGFISVVPVDPLTSSLHYTYVSLAATNGGSTCTGYHLGTSLENIKDSSLTSDVDSTASATICAGSSPSADFSGLSAAAGGSEACNATAGTTQPGGTESCFDVKP